MIAATPSGGNASYRPHIDGLRAVAVLAVLIFHAFPAALPGGFIGVDVFFVISGFLISEILIEQFGRPGATAGRVIAGFYARRVRRIFPSLIVVLVVGLFLGYRYLAPDELVELAKNSLAAAGFSLNLVLAHGAGYFGTDPGSNPILHLWSLGVEEQFYLVWPLVLGLALRWRRGCFPMLVFLAAASYFWNAQKYFADYPAAFFLPQMRLWELAIGSIAAAWVPLWPMRGRLGVVLGNFGAVAGLGLIVAGFVMIRSDPAYPTAQALLPTCGAALVVASPGSAWVNRWCLALPVLVFIGLISYPLYLWHWPLLSFTHLLAIAPDSVALKLTDLGLAVLLAWLTYRFVEQPVRRGRLGRRTVPVLLGALAAVAGVAGIAWSTQGFPRRFSPEFLALVNRSVDTKKEWRVGTYLLIGDQNSSSFPADPNEIVPGRPSLVLWGDSYAAALYPGFHTVLGDRLNIIERTVTGTAPMMAGFYAPGNGQEVSAYVFNLILRVKPKYVVLAGRWPNYHWENLRMTIAALKAAGVPRVVLVGPEPDWIDSLPRQVMNQVRRHRDEPIPVRLKTGYDPTLFDLDARMAAFAAETGAEYFSPAKIWSNPEGILVRIGEPSEFVAYDSGHLTPRGSVYLVAHFPLP